MFRLPLLAVERAVHIQASCAANVLLRNITFDLKMQSPLADEQ